MADRTIDQEPNHVTSFTNIPRFPVVDDPTGTPIEGYMDTDDITTIAATETASQIAALGTLGNVSSSGAVTPGNLAVWIDADTIEDGGPVPVAGGGNVSSSGAVVAGHVAIWIDADTIEDGGSLGGGRTLTTVTANYVALGTDDLIICNRATPMSVTLLAATGSGRKVTVASIGAGVITVQVASSGYINSTLTYPLNQWDSIDLVDIGTGQYLIVAVA